MSTMRTHSGLLGALAGSIALTLLTIAAEAQMGGPNDGPRPPRIDAGPATEDVSPVRRIRRDENRQGPQNNDGPSPDAALEVQSIDGSDNNLDEPAMNMAHEPLYRWLPSDYADGVSAVAGENRPGPREISNMVADQPADIPNDAGLTDFFWQWGQFLDHDIDLTDGTDPAEFADILVPAGDLWFDPDGTGEVFMPLNRSLYDDESGTSTETPREQINEITGWIDASNVYGSDPERAAALRMLDGSGRLRTSNRNLLPLNDVGLPNAGGDGEELFLAGDVRANEQVGLLAMHTLFVREHNRQARLLRQSNPQLSGNAIYEQVRARVGGLMQVITYREFVPALLGEEALAPYEGYDPDVDARIMNSFSTGAFRLGHSLLSPTLLRINADGTEHEAGHLPLRNAFFAPFEISDHGIHPVLRGLAAQVCQQLDSQIIDDVRNFLFGAPGQGGFDLAALNIQRGRDHGLPSYNEARRQAGLRPVRDFRDVSRDPEVRRRLREVYDTANDIDLWVGGLAEDHVPGAQVGPLFHRILSRQFAALRDGDRFWYENRFAPEVVADLEATRLSDIIRRNTRIGDELSDDVFRISAN